ncbi:hypothetical protein GPECTOR_69g433 [Gonium pectorale]|uniref:Uncharacterized protein n=1 Tax=Gonium pectorale TaxID=33097 RepID=A0A150G4V9_GONPE|nr:hypothetical protein GPECTOR_69g433 [Gonium pectorale]|eukprot:KXZ44340.1 hypothetical protein GPECTOR_69g433 [Gonium pectorale]
MPKSLSTAILGPGPPGALEGTSNSDGGVVTGGGASTLHHALGITPGGGGGGGGGLFSPPGIGGGGAAVAGLPPGAGGAGPQSTGTTPLPPFSHHVRQLSVGMAGGGAEGGLQSLAEYVAAETHPAEKLPTADVVWGQTERERVYNFLLHVPYQLERLIWFGSMLLLDSFLGVFTLLPLRCAIALLQLLGMLRGGAGSGAVASGGAERGGGRGRRGANAASDGRPSSTGDGDGATDGPAVAAAATAAAPAAATPATPRTTIAATASTAVAGGGGAAAERRPQPRLAQQQWRLSGSQLYDMVCLGLLCCATAVLRAVRPGSIYYWLKDITSEFLKMSVLSTAFDMLDKILSNFGNDVLEALSGTCTQWLAGRKRGLQLAADAGVAGALITLHALTLMCQALILAVALNSSRNGLVALLIANNFVEIKSTVFKKWDSTRIWALVCADAVERFHLVVVLSFVVVEEMDSAASWAPPPDYLRVCGLMAAAELVIDVVKHAVLGKFNDVRPGIYREFHQVGTWDGVWV